MTEVWSGLVHALPVGEAALAPLLALVAARGERLATSALLSGPPPVQPLPPPCCDVWVDVSPLQ